MHMKANSKKSTISRRHFITRTGLLVGTATLGFPYIGKVLGANDRVNVACIGVGGKGDSDSTNTAKAGGNIFAICDVDKNTLEKKGKEFPDAKRYQDYRKL